TLKIPPGVYYFNSIYTSANGHLDFTLPPGTPGAVTFFVAGNVVISSRIYTNQQNSHNFSLEVVTSGTYVWLNSPEPVYGVIYCPLSDVFYDMKKPCFGSVIGKSLVMTNQQFHYD